MWGGGRGGGRYSFHGLCVGEGRKHTFDTRKETAVVVVGALQRVANRDGVLALSADLDGLSRSWRARRHGGLSVCLIDRLIDSPFLARPKQSKKPGAMSVCLSVCMYVCLARERERAGIFIFPPTACAGRGESDEVVCERAVLWAQGASLFSFSLPGEGMVVCSSSGGWARHDICLT